MFLSSGTSSISAALVVPDVSHPMRPSRNGTRSKMRRAMSANQWSIGSRHSKDALVDNLLAQSDRRSEGKAPTRSSARASAPTGR